MSGTRRLVRNTNTAAGCFVLTHKTFRAPPAELGGGGRGGGGGHAVQRHAAREDDCARAPSQKFGSMMMMLGRVRFEDLVVQENEEVLGEGTFGTVLRGAYEGEDVAIKKARDFRGSARVKELFRCG